MTSEMKKQLKSVIGLTFLLSGILFIIVALIRLSGLCTYKILPVFFGIILGTVVSSLNMLFLAISIEKSVDKGKNGARWSMTTSYVLRLFMIAAMVVVAIKFNNIFNYIAAVIPVVFPRIAITIIGASGKGKKDEC